MRYSALIGFLGLVMGLIPMPVLPASSVLAGSTGLENIHQLRREGARLCMVGHYHYGADSSPVSKARALQNAKRKWADFVILEYGTDWGRFSLAANKGGKCTGNRSSGFHCSVSARPCKALRVRKARRTVMRKTRRYQRKKAYRKKIYKRRSLRKRRSTRRR